MKAKHSPIFQGFKIGNVRLRNRIAMCPMGTHSDGLNGELVESQFRYYEERAKGGVGLVVVEGQAVTNKTDPWMYYQTVAGTESQVMTWTHICEQVHAHGAKVAFQLICGLGKNAFFYGDEGEAVPVSSSEIGCYYSPETKCRPLTKEEIKDVVIRYGMAAERAVRSGADMVEIHAHAGYLIDQFMTRQWNQRTDEYGGSFENRMRFITEIYQSMRQFIPNTPIMVRMALEHCFDGGRSIEEGIEIIKYLEKLGIDAIDIDVGSYETGQWVCPSVYQGDASMRYSARAIREAGIKIPILNAGTYTPDTAADAIESGDVDIVMLGRALIADPEWVNKLREGKEEEIRPCLSCNQYCCGRLYTNQYISCAVNPCAGQEANYQITKADVSKKIAVVGGGPGGMEAARVAALKGHDVTLYEKADHLGGQLVYACAPAFKTRIAALLEWQKLQLSKLDNVKVVLNKEITADAAELAEADEIFVATGATPFIPNIPGVDLPYITEVTAAHADESLIKGDKIVITGGGLSGCDCALELGMAGKDVTVVELMEGIALKEYDKNRLALLQAFEDNGVKQMINTKVVEFTPEGVVVENAEGRTVLPADTAILAFGSKPNSKIADEIFNKYPHARIIGDCDKVGMIGEAFRGGFFAGWSAK